MTVGVGALVLPAPVPATGTSGDPALDIVGAYLRAVLQTFLATKWASLAPNEPVVRTLNFHDPEELDFRERDLPLLVLWKERALGDEPRRIADGWTESHKTVHVLWIPPPTTQTRGSTRFPFFNDFASVIEWAVHHERHPSYVHASEVADPAAIAYGSDVLALARIDQWIYRGTQRAPVEVGTGTGALSYPAYLATLTVVESTLVDNTAWGTEPTVIQFDLTTGDDDPFTTQSALVPPDADEDP